MPVVVGVDVSPDMLAQARVHADERGLRHLQLLPSDDALSAVHGEFDLVHSCITFQHIEMPRGRRLFARLLELLTPGGMGAIQVTYAKAYLPDTFGQPPEAGLVVPRPPPPEPAPGAPPRDPEMQMNTYNLNELAFMLQSAGIKNVRTDFTDHGGELGVFLFFMKPAPPRAQG